MFRAVPVSYNSSVVAFAALVLLGSTIGIWGCSPAESDPKPSAESAETSGASNRDGSAPDAQNAAPDFTLETTEGHKVSLRDYRGKVVFVNFWATWCPPCRKEIPDFIELQAAHSKDLVILGISLDRSVGDVAPFVEANKINYPILLQGNVVANDYGQVQKIPTTFIVDQKGRIVERIQGVRPRSYFESVLGKLTAS